MLVLLDIDGTLLHGESTAQVESLIAAARACSGCPVTRADWDAIEIAGRTDMWIARRMLKRHGLSDAAIDALRPSMIEYESARFSEIAPRRLAPSAVAGAAPALRQLASAGVSLALLTGNLEQIAHAKIEMAGFAGLFERGQGAFGSDAEERNLLVPFALARAEPTTQACVVGDTPFDIACARAGGVAAIAVASGSFTEAELSDADVVLASVAELERGLLALGWRLNNQP